MEGERDKMKKWLIGLGSLFFICCGIVVIIFERTPAPGTALIRYAFNREVPMKNVEQYEQQKMKSKVVSDLTYPSKYGRNTMDLYYPNDVKANEKLPIIVWVHGGAYIAGDKSFPKGFARYIVGDRRVAFVSINYELAPELRYPGQVVQLEEAVTEVKKLASRYRFLNTDKWILGGDSAGAQIAGQFTLIQTNPAYAKDMARQAILSSDNLIGFVSFCGPLDLPQMKEISWKNPIMALFARTVGWDLTGQKNWQDSDALKQSSLVEHATADFPASYVTDAPLLSFQEQGEAFVQTLQRKNVAVTSLFFNESTKLAHEYQFSFETAEAQQNLALFQTYLDDILKNK